MLGRCANRSRIEKSFDIWTVSIVKDRGSVLMTLGQNSPKMFTQHSPRENMIVINTTRDLITEGVTIAFPGFVRLWPLYEGGHVCSADLT